MKLTDPYVHIPRDLWDNAVAFSSIAKVDVYVVLMNALREHLTKHSSLWTEKQKQVFAKKLEALKEQAERE